MESYKISFQDDKSINNVHHIGIDYNGNYYSCIFGKYVNGGFLSILNWEIGCELSEDFEDEFWNVESIERVIKDRHAAKAIAKAIAKVGKSMRCKQ